jgi:nuclear pore complex protein Nup205
MAEGSLDAFEGILRDLEALKEDRLPNIDRLSTELEARIGEFQALLDHKKRNNESRRKLSDGLSYLSFMYDFANVSHCSGEIEVDDLVYSINEEFRQQTIQIADELDLDEIESARLFLRSQNDAQEWDRSPLVGAIMRFHKRRHFLLESLRIAFETAWDPAVDKRNIETEEEEEDQREAGSRIAEAMLTTFANLVLQQNAGIDHPPKFWAKCFQAMKDIESGIQRVVDRTHRASVVGQPLSNDEEQIMEYERETLHIQHESLSIIVTMLMRRGFAALKTFRELLDRAKSLDKHDSVMLHYIPVLMASCGNFASAGANCTTAETRVMHKLILEQADSSPWSLRTFYQAFLSWWIVEFKGRFSDPNDVDATTTPESQILIKALKDGGLQFMLSVAQDIKRSDWSDSAKMGLTTFLLRESSTLSPDSPPTSKFFTDRLMEHIQWFVDAFITNIPDTLRLLKYEEDDQRKLLRSRFQKNTSEYQYDLDTFLVLIAYAYQDDPESSKSFWVDIEGNLHGFLQWAAKRQTTPRVAAFCEMLRSISEGSECAESAHRFLLQEGTPVAGKLRRTSSLSWNQIFAELEFYSSSIKERPVQTQSTVTADAQQQMDQLIEPESAIMLECYLRLITHLCYSSAEIRNWLWNTENISLPLILFQLCNSSIETRLRGYALSTLASLITDKGADIAENMWILLDGWISGTMFHSTNLPRPSTISSPQQVEKKTYDQISSTFEESNAFMQLLNALVVPITGDEGSTSNDLPFPPGLGSSYRLPGIDSYVDCALGIIFAGKTTQISDPHQLALLRLNCLDFICTCISSFNEDLVIIANRSNLPVEKTLKIPSLASYIALHPFSRVMEWLFDDKCLDALFAAAHQDVDHINRHDSSSPLVLSTVRAIEVMNFVMKLQSTYVDIVRPILRRAGPSKRIVSHSSVPSFEDAVLKRLNLVVDLGLYCGLGHSELSLCSLSLLESLSSSKRLASPAVSTLGKRADRNRLISILEKDGEAQRISRSLTMMLTWDPREFETGPLASGYSIKSSILSFLKNCLAASPDRPTIAHLLLGFTCNGNSLDVDTDGIFALGHSLFHGVARLALEYPDFDGITFMSWASNIKEACFEILRLLCQSPLSSNIVMPELRLSDFAFLQAARQITVGPNSLWDGIESFDDQFLIKDSAIALRNFLRQRSGYYDYFARELRHAKESGITSHLLRLQSVLLGSTTFPGEPATQTPNIFELLDFLEVGFNTELAMPDTKHFKEADFAVCKTETAGPGELFDLARAHEVITLRRKDFLTTRPPSTQIVRQSSGKSEDRELKEFDSEGQSCLFVLLSRNHWRDLALAQFETLNSWIRLIVVALDSCEFASEVRAAFIQQAFQLVLPKFEKMRNDDLEAAIKLAEFLNQLMISSVSKESSKLNDKQSTPARSRTTSLDGTSDIQLRAFQTALNAIVTTSSTPAFRQPCYQVCYRFLHSLTQSSSKSTMRKRSILKNVKLVSDRLMEILCDDVYTGDAKSRIFALLLLESLIAISAADDAKLILDPLDRLNFVGIMVDSVKQIPSDLRQAAPAGKSSPVNRSL